MPKEKEQAEKQEAAQAKGQATTTNDKDGDVNMDLPDDEPPTAKMRRHKKREMDYWAKEVVQNFTEKKGAEIKSELQSDTPDFAKIEEIFREINGEIRNANEEHGAPLIINLLPVTAYRANYDAWLATVKSDSIDPENGWRAYNQLHKVFRLTNRENGLPDDWNIPSDWTQKRFGDRPGNIPEDPDTDSAYDYSDDSESDESDSDESDGINGLESRMRHEYSSLSRGKALWWWPIGTGSQVLVRYGNKETPIYRVRAGSSQPYDPQRTELVLRNTRGNRKFYDKERNKEVWEYTRDQVSGIIGVGWKIENDDEVNINPLRSLRPTPYASYPHTRVLVRWKDGEISLERRGFVRRIVNGNSINGDRMIYLKAKELEKAYRGYDIELDSDENSNSDGGISDRSSKRLAQKRLAHSARSGISSSGRPRGVHFAESEGEESDADSDMPQSRRRAHDRKSKFSNDKMDIHAKIRLLTEELRRLQVEERSTRRRNRRRRD